MVGTVATIRVSMEIVLEVGAGNPCSEQAAEDKAMGVGFFG